MKIRHVLTVVGLAAAAVLVPALPAAADAISEYAHAGFRSNDNQVSLDLDVSRVGGVTTISAEWGDYACETDGVSRVCSWVFREAHNVPVTNFQFSLGSASVTVELPYEEQRRVCSYPGEEEGDETCVDEQGEGGTTTLDVTWTSVGEPQHSEWTDEAGVRYLTVSVSTTVTGTGFGMSYGGNSSFGQLARVRSIPAGTA